MSMTVELTGLTELLTALRDLPQELVTEATTIVEHHAETARAQLVQRYPPKQITEGLGLREGVELEMLTSSYGVHARLRSRSPAAHLWEFGTQDRHTQEGWNRGRAPEHDGGLGPIAER